VDASTALALPDPPLRDDVVALRPWVASDADVLERVGRDVAIRRFRASHPRSSEETRAWLAHIESGRLTGDRLELAVTDARSEVVVGAVTLWSVRLAYRSAMMNYWVAPEARGRGVATAAVRLLARWCFDSLGLARLQLFVEPDNAASLRTAEACGFIEEGRLRSHVEHEGHRYDSLVYGLLPGELR
jgi:RimJ/RimL family protein N-acetyltransferase